MDYHAMQMGNGLGAGTSNLAPPTESCTSILGEIIAGTHELNSRISQAADRLTGPVPQPASTNQKDVDTTIVAALRYLRSLIQHAHQNIDRIQQGL